MKKQKIIFCMHQIIIGGIETCLVRIVENLLTTDEYEFKIVTRKKVTEDFFVDFFKEHNIEIFCLEENCNNKHLKNIFKNCDIIIDYFNCSFLSELKDIKKPKIGVYHSSINFFNKDYANKQDLLFNTYDKFVCLTKSFRQDIVEKYPQYKNKIVQIYNPIDIKSIKELANQGLYPENEKYFVFLARFHSDKDHDCVIDAFNLLNSKIKNAKIYFLGAGEKENEYKAKVKHLGLDDKIIFSGVLQNPYGYLKHSVANILSSPNEGLSNVLIEGAALEVLNIASNCKSSVAEVLLDGKGGLLFPIGDSKTLSEIMFDVWNEKINKQFYIKNASDNVNRFNMENIISKFKSLISETIVLNKKKQYKNNIQKFFSLKKSSDGKHKILIIMGIKFKFKYINKSYKKIEKNYNNVLKRIKSSKNKLKVIFLVTENQKWCYQSLYELLEKDQNFEPLILVSIITDVHNGVDNTRNNLKENYDFFKSKNMNVDFSYRNNEYIPLEYFSPDVVFYEQPGVFPEYYSPEYVSNFALTSYVSYGFEFFYSKYNYCNFQQSMWKYFIDSPLTLKRYIEHYSKYAARNCVVTGYSKMDAYFNKNKINVSKYWRNPEKTKIIYAPHHSFDDWGLQLATFQYNGNFILEFAKKHPETTWVFKPHPRFKYAVISNNIMTEEEIDRYYDEWGRIGKVYTQGDYFDIFKSSDMLITDCCSFLAEYLPTEKPLIKLVNEKSAKINPLGEQISNSCYKIYNNETLDTLLSWMLLNPENDYKKLERKEMEKLVFDSKEKVANKIYNYLKKI